tara:strand:+ start:10462 stop:10590 length:129 start_codon:yes stop_codon:yes gene_type:complete
MKKVASERRHFGYRRIHVMTELGFQIIWRCKQKSRRLNELAA